MTVSCGSTSRTRSSMVSFAISIQRCLQDIERPLQVVRVQHKCKANFVRTLVRSCVKAGRRRKEHRLAVQLILFDQPACKMVGIAKGKADDNVERSLGFVKCNTRDLLESVIDHITSVPELLYQRSSIRSGIA